MMCRLLRVSRSGYYDWSQRAESARSRRNRELRLLIRQIHLESNGVYGARKVHRELLELGEEVGRHRVARIMRADGLKGCPKRRFRRAAIAPRLPNYSASAGRLFIGGWRDMGFSWSLSD
jgi:putative transposase